MTNPSSLSQTAPGFETRGRVVKLDRGFPLVQLEDGTTTRAQYDRSFSTVSNGAPESITVGDQVVIAIPEGHDRAIIKGLEPRRTSLLRRDPSPEAQKQVLAANFDWVFIVEPLNDLNLHRLERELVVAYLTGASLALLLTKTDLVTMKKILELKAQVQELVDDELKIVLLGKTDSDIALNELRSILEGGKTAVLLGKSGAGKSTLVNRLAGRSVQQTAEVRSSDGRGRHTTVARTMIPLDNGGWVMDMPGVRGIGLWEAEKGLKSAFADITALATQCRFRDCRHRDEPGCAVREAVESGELSARRLRYYQMLHDEIDANASEKKRQQWSKRR